MLPGNTGHTWSHFPHLHVVDADAAVGEEAVLGALAADLSAGLLREEVGHRRVPVAEVLEGRVVLDIRRLH